MIITFEFLFGYMYILRNFGAEKKNGNKSDKSSDLSFFLIFR